MHFITAIGYDDTYMYANDPNNKTVPRKQAQSKFKSCMKQAFLFWPEIKKPDPEPDELKIEDQDEEVEIPAEVTSDSLVLSGATGTEIVDVSRHQGTIDWDKLAPELAFVIIKASGLYSNGADTQYANNVKGAVSHGVPFHAYHFLYCTTESEAKRDAKLFYDTVKGNGHMPLYWVLDCEKEWGVANSKAKPIAEAFEAELRRLAGDNIKVAVYIGHNVYSDYALDYGHYAYVWIPRYGSNNGTLSGSTKPSYKCDLWQYTSTGRVAGISGNVDMNVITGDGHDLTWFLGGKPAASTSVTPSAASTSPKKVVIGGGNCYVRTLPNTSGSILGVAYNGDELEYGGTIADTGWPSVMFNGKAGYVSNKYGKLV